jgi:hypothetical protein
LKYYRNTLLADVGDILLAEWYDGNVWTQLETTVGRTGWTEKTFVLPASANNNPYFLLRFVATITRNNREIYIDNFSITGITYKEPTPSPIPTPTPESTGSPTPPPTPTPAPTPRELFFDGFESGNFIIGGWTSRTNVSVSNINPRTGIYSVRMKKTNTTTTSSFLKILPTTLFTNIVLNYNRIISSVNPTDSFRSQWYDGAAWNTLENTIGNSGWTSINYLLPSSAFNNPGFRIRFSTTITNNAGRGYVDDVQILGTP